MALTNRAAIKRYEQFKKDVDDLKEHADMVYYSTEISAATGEDKGNVSRYYNGEAPIGKNFLEKFREAYGKTLRKIRKNKKEPDRPVASDKPIQLPQTDPSDTPPDTSSPDPNIFDPTTENITTEARLTRIEESIEKIATAMAILTQKIDARSKPPRKKK